MKNQRRKHSPEFKAKVALEVIQDIKTLSEIAPEYEIYPVLAGTWKKDMLERLPELFETERSQKEKDAEKEQGHLHRKVGQLMMGVDCLEKKCKQLGIPVKGRNS